MNYKIIILSLIAFVLFSANKCGEPDIPTDPPPPPPECDFNGNGYVVFDELALEYDENSNKMPYRFPDDHEDYNGNPIISTFENLFEDNFFSSDPNTAELKYIITGNSCNGTFERIINNSVPSDYSIDMLNKMPYEKNQHTVDVDVIIKSAVYNGTFCMWSFSVTDKWFTQADVLDVDYPMGVWMSKSKEDDDGSERKVYVHDSFNNYIYSI